MKGTRLNITCEVSSRPDSDIIITNHHTSDIVLSEKDTHKAVYVFDSVDVLDSAVYQCNASNGIQPVSGVTKQMTLDIKGNYKLKCRNTCIYALVFYFTMMHFFTKLLN